MARIVLKQRTREIWQKLSHLNARPDQIAAGFSIGTFASFLPLNSIPNNHGGRWGVVAEKERDGRSHRGCDRDSLYPAFALNVAS